MKVLLTSCGIETKGIKEKFLEFININILDVKVLFIPTAADSAEAIEILPECINDLLKCGIKKENIIVYNLHKPMDIFELEQYSAIYICGGSPAYLLNCVNEQGFNQTILEYIKRDGIVVGVSAGSIIFAQNMESNLGLLNQRLNVHCSDDECEDVGKIDMLREETIKLGNKQAIVLEQVYEAYVI